MTELERFRDHCRTMADGAHSPECIAGAAEAQRRWSYRHLFGEWLEQWGEQPTSPPVPCPGSCASSADRALFARLAAEVDAYLSTDQDEGLFA